MASCRQKARWRWRMPSCRQKARWPWRRMPSWRQTARWPWRRRRPIPQMACSLKALTWKSHPGWSWSASSWNPTCRQQRRWPWKSSYQTQALPPHSLTPPLVLPVGPWGRTAMAMSAGDIDQWRSRAKCWWQTQLRSSAWRSRHHPPAPQHSWRGRCWQRARRVPCCKSSFTGAQFQPNMQ